MYNFAVLLVKSHFLWPIYYV